MVKSDSMQPSGGSALDGLLASYSAGTLDPATHALVASHLVLRPENRRYVAALEELAGDELLQAEPAPLSDRDRRLAEIFGETPPMPRPPSAGLLPAPLLRLIGKDLDEVAWRTRLPGVKEYRVAEMNRGEASLIMVKAGRRMPSHTHEGSEITLVLKGGFTDVTGHYARGDIAIAGADLDHRPVTDADSNCLCFTVTDAPLHLTGPIGRILERLLRRR